MRQIRALALALALALAAPAAASAAAALHRHVYATCTARGGSAACTAGWGVSDRDSDDGVSRPADVRVHVWSALPGQVAVVRWAWWCFTTAGGVFSGVFEIVRRTPVSALVAVPRGALRCGVTARAELGRHSRWLEVRITYWN